MLLDVWKCPCGWMAPVKEFKPCLDDDDEPCDDIFICPRCKDAIFKDDLELAVKKIENKTEDFIPSITISREEDRCLLYCDLYIDGDRKRCGKGWGGDKGSGLRAGNCCPESGIYILRKE